MPKSRIILALGFFIALLPVLGFPHTWESFFEVASGLLIVLLSVLISVDRRLTLKAKAEKRTYRKKALVSSNSATENTAAFGRRATDMLGASYGRRATDKPIPTELGDERSEEDMDI